MPIAERFQFLEERWRLKSLKNVACSDKIFRAVSEEPFIWKVAAKPGLINSIHQNVFKSSFRVGGKQILTYL